MSSELMDHYRARLAVLDAVLAAKERRKDLMDLMARSANTQAARDAVEQMLGCEPQAAQAVVDLRVSQFTELDVEMTKRERHDLLDAIHHLEEHPDPNAWGSGPDL